MRPAVTSRLVRPLVPLRRALCAAAPRAATVERHTAAAQHPQPTPHALEALCIGGRAKAAELRLDRGEEPVVSGGHAGDLVALVGRQEGLWSSPCRRTVAAAVIFFIRLDFG